MKFAFGTKFEHCSLAFHGVQGEANAQTLRKEISILLLLPRYEGRSQIETLEGGGDSGSERSKRNK